MKEISPTELAAWLGDPAREQPQVVDVREPWEVAIARLAGALEIPMGRVVAAADSLDRDRPVVCVCHHGMRSLQVAMYLSRLGFGDVRNLSGGIHAWATQVDPAMATY